MSIARIGIRPRGVRHTIRYPWPLREGHAKRFLPLRYPYSAVLQRFLASLQARLPEGVSFRIGMLGDELLDGGIVLDLQLGRGGQRVDRSDIPPELRPSFTALLDAAAEAWLSGAAAVRKPREK